MKKVLISILIILTIILMGSLIFYFYGMSPKSEEHETIVFTIEPGTSKTMIAKNLAKSGLIRSELVLDAYLFFNKINIQAGDYELSADMKPTSMLEKFQNGDVKINSSSITLVEGQRLTDYATTLAENLSFTKEEFLDTANDQTFLNSLLANENYWFLTDQILNNELYYPLEGYLFPDTYEFLNNVTPEEVITKILDHTSLKLQDYKEQMQMNSYSIHELLTMASIVEKEANTENDRKTAAQVFYTRLNENWSLGSDVTSFYGARKEMGKDSETIDVLNNRNPYNTRLTDGSMNGKLPIGPICNPSITSIIASLEPSPTTYHYFVANTCTGEVAFLNTASEFYAKTTELVNQGCL